MKINKFQRPAMRIEEAEAERKRKTLSSLQTAPSDTFSNNPDVRRVLTNRKISTENTLQKRMTRRPGMLSYDQTKKEKLLKRLKTSPWYSRIPTLNVSPNGQYSAYTSELFYKDLTGKEMPALLRPTPEDNFKYVVEPTIGAMGLPMLINNPFVTIPTVGLSLAGEAIGNEGSKLLTGNTIDENISNLTGMPESVSRYFNPALWLGGRQGYNMVRRGIETAMRTGAGAEPIGSIIPNIKSMWLNGDRKRLFDIANYITTGTKTGQKGSYNSFKYNPYVDSNHNRYYDYYRGFLDDNPDMLKVEGNDVIDAFLYGKTIDPNYGLYLQAGNNKKDYGYFQKYIEKFYPFKDVKIYNTERYPRDFEYKNLKDYKLQGLDSSITTAEGYEYDSAGHLLERGVTPDNKIVRREQDIWKFEPEAYYKKWIKNYDGSEPSRGKRFLIKNGLKAVDAVGKPIIVKSPWRTIDGQKLLYTPNPLGSQLNYALLRKDYSFPKTEF